MMLSSKQSRSSSLHICRHSFRCYCCSPSPCSYASWPILSNLGRFGAPYPKQIPYQGPRPWKNSSWAFPRSCKTWGARSEVVFSSLRPQPLHSTPQAPLHLLVSRPAGRRVPIRTSHTDSPHLSVLPPRLSSRDRRGDRLWIAEVRKCQKTILRIVQ